MEGLELLKGARAAGLVVTADGDQLFIRGPKRLAAIVQQLIANKPAVMAALRPPASTADGCCQPTESDPVSVTVNGKTYDVAMTVGRWFFRFSPEAGWTAAGPEFSELIEEQLGQSPAVGSDKRANRSPEKPNPNGTPACRPRDDDLGDRQRLRGHNR